MIPKPLRRSGKGSPGRIRGLLSGEWNPATFFIVISLIIGSNAIQLVSLKTRRLNYKRSTEAKLSLLREVIGKVQRGEDVDVEAMLGTGDPEREKEWEEVMKDLQQEVDVWEDKGKSGQENQSTERSDTVAANGDEDLQHSASDRKPGFY